MGRKLLIWYGIMVLLAAAHSGMAQQAGNPFELIPRLDPEALEAAEADVAGVQDTASVNPFDIVREAPLAPGDATPYVVNPNVEPILNTNWDRFRFFSVGIMLLLLAIMVSLVGSSLNNAFRSFLNDNAFNQYFREREGRGAQTYYVLHGFFFVNLGLFLVYLLRHYEVTLPWSAPSRQWLILALGTALLFMGKHLLLLIVGSIFPVWRDIRRYIFLILVFSITIGVALIPANMLMAYGPEGSESTVVYLTLGSIGLVYLYRVIRGLLIANTYLVLHRFHFLLYICSVEIAPVMIIVRLILNQQT